jgi:hypothetical protein
MTVSLSNFKVGACNKRDDSMTISFSNLGAEAISGKGKVGKHQPKVFEPTCLSLCTIAELLQYFRIMKLPGSSLSILIHL